jgi:hypothetical protein
MLEQKRVTSAEIGKAENLLKMSESQLADILRQINRFNSVAGAGELHPPSTLEIYYWFVAKEKAIYNALNHLKTRGQFDTTYTGFIWAPIQQEQ